MKKIVCLVLIVAMLCLTACNMSVGIGNFNFRKVHVDTHGYSGCLAIKKWHDNERGIEVETEEVGAIFLSEGTYILIENECPFCKMGGGE